MNNICRCCGDEVNPKRWELGYKVCLFCGEELAQQVSKSHTIAPLNKSNYYYIHDPQTLKELNPKRTT